jgi:hypothetical protein
MECACYLKMTVSERATLRPVSFTMAFALRLFRQKHSLVSCRSLEKYQILTYSIEIALFETTFRAYSIVRFFLGCSCRLS